MSRPALAEPLAQVGAQVAAVIRQSDYWQSVLPPHLSQACYSYFERGGKFLRSALLVWSARLLGAPQAAASQAAAAVEVFHAWSLVHDDIIDRDDRRRGGPTVHALARERAAQAGMSAPEAAHYGLTVGVLAGDLLHGWSTCLLAALPGSDAWPELLARLEGRVLRRVVGGELLDVELSHRPLEAVSDEQVLQVTDWKTAELFAYCGWAGARLAAAGPDQQARLERFGRHMGTAFQLRDDILGLVGDPQQMGKPVGSDLKEGKRTLPLLAAWRQADAGQRQALAQALSPQADEAQRQAAAELIAALGGVAAAQGLAEQHQAWALDQLPGLPARAERDLLADLAAVSARRDR